MFREIKPKFVKITMCARRSRLVFQSKTEMGLYLDLEALNRACDRFTCVHFTANCGHEELV